MRIFVDVGAHLGESIDIALNPRFGFDQLYALEPARSCIRQLRRFHDDRVEALQFGLSNVDADRELYGSGFLGASLFYDKQFIDARSAEIVERVSLRRASTWLAEHSGGDDEVYLKLNCEGSECDILDDIARHEDVWKRIRSAYVDFDIRKVPSLAYRADETRSLIASVGIPWVEPDETISAQRNIEAWLTGAIGTERIPFRRRVRYFLGLHRPLYVHARVIAKKLLPQPAYRALGSRARGFTGLSYGGLAGVVAMIRRRGVASKRDEAQLLAPMSVLVVTGIFPPDHGGPATHSYDIAKGLRGLGASVTVVSLTDQRRLICESDLIRLPRHWPWPARLVWLCGWFVLKRASYDVVYATGLYLPAALGCAMARRPIIMKVAGDPAWERSRRLNLTDLDFSSFQRTPPPHLRVRAMRFARTLPARLSTRLIAPNAELAAAVDDWVSRSGATAVVPNGVSVPEGISRRPLLPWRGRIVYVGRLVDHKRVDVLLRALESVPAAQLTVVGDGPAADGLKVLAKRLGVASRVQFLGVQSHGRVLEILRDSDVLVNCSDWEGLPHVVLEALVLGLPVVASPSGGTARVVTDQVNGLIVDPCTPAALGAALSRLDTDPILFDQLCTEAVKSGAEHPASNVISRVATECRNLVEGRKQSGSERAESRPFAVFVGRAEVGEDEETEKRQALARHFNAVIVGRGSGGVESRDGVTLIKVPAHLPAPLRMIGVYGVAPLLALALASRRRGAVVFQSAYEALAATVVIGILPSRLRPVLVVEVHGDWRSATRLYGSRFRRLFSPIVDRLATVAIRRADRIRVIGDYTDRIVRQAGYRGPVDRYIAYSNFQLFLEPGPCTLPTRPSVVFVGMLQPPKAPDVLLRAWAVVQKTGCPARLVLAGDGPMRASLQQLAVELDIQDSVRFVGHVSRQKLVHLIDQSWFLVLPSRSEGLGRVVLEAMARGRAVVGSRVGGIPELVEHGVTGLLVEPDSVDQLAAAIISMCDPSTARELGAAARAIVERMSLDTEWEAGIARLATALRGSRVR